MLNWIKQRSPTNYFYQHQTWDTQDNSLPSQEAQIRQMKPQQCNPPTSTVFEKNKLIVIMVNLLIMALNCDRTQYMPFRIKIAYT